MIKHLINKIKSTKEIKNNNHIELLKLYYKSIRQLREYEEIMKEANDEQYLICSKERDVLVERIQFLKREIERLNIKYDRNLLISMNLKSS